MICNHAPSSHTMPVCKSWHKAKPLSAQLLRGCYRVPQDWQVPLGRRFRALKVWFVLRIYGQQGLQSYIQHHLRLAKLFQGLVEADERFEIAAPPRFGLICFALKVQHLTAQSLNCVQHSQGSSCRHSSLIAGMDIDWISVTNVKASLYFLTLCR